MHFAIKAVGQYFFLISLALVAIYWLRANRALKWSLAARLVGGGALALLLDQLAGDLYYDPRPFVTHHLVPIIPHAADNGFPSDHALLTSFLAFTLWAYSKRLSLVLFVNALLVSWARVAAHIHNPRDIVGGFAIALVSSLVADLVARAWSRHRRPASSPT